MYLIGLFPPTQGEYSRFSLRSADNFIQLQCRIVRYQESFFPFSIKIWNNLSLDLTFNIWWKATILYFSSCTYNKLFDHSISRQAFILHTRLRLGYCALNDYLFKINCSLSPKCRCGLANETVKHFFLFCPLFAAQRARLFTSAAQIYGDHWSQSNDKRKIEYLLNGISDFDYQLNCRHLSWVLIVSLWRMCRTFLLLF